MEIGQSVGELFEQTNNENSDNTALNSSVNQNLNRLYSSSSNIATESALIRGL